MSRERDMKQLKALLHEESCVLNISGYFRGYCCKVENVYILHIQDIRRTFISSARFYTDQEFETILDKLYKHKDEA